MGSIESEVKRVFHAALDAASDAERDEVLARECGASATLRARVEALLAAHERAGTFLEPGTAALRAAEQAGQTIGRYKLLQPIGEGGFGSVWMAEQREPVKRRVALKIIKLGMDTKQVIARFEAERQALAMMDHPNIAKVLDAGATDTGRPFFVMELVKGVSLLDYCDSEKLDTRQRLELFVAVCQAIQHAHQKGVIHRDIKPSNVLVTLHDGVAVPKVIDFGIAKATSGELTAKTLFTEHRQMIGTPAYMSPEQAEMSGLDIDTRADIYSLGVLLYELLTGTTPFDTKVLVANGIAEMMRVIREVEPHKPSTRISRLGDTGTRMAGQRRSDVRRLGLLLRGDLDWIVMKCLEKDRSRRYETASNLAADIRRHLSDEPVIAGPPSRAYRLRKFVRRNRAAVLAGSALTLTLVAGIVGTSFGMWRAVTEKRAAQAFADAEMRERERARENEEKATAEAQRAESEARRAQNAEAQAQRRSHELEEVARFQESQLATIDPERMGFALRNDVLAELRAALERDGLAPDAIAAEEQRVAALLARANWTNVALKTLDASIFSRAVDAIDRDFEDQPLVRARLLQTLAGTLQALGMLDAANGPQERALEIRRAQLGEEHADTLHSLNSQSALWMKQGKSAESEALTRSGLAIARRALGEDHATTISLLNDLGSLLQDRGEVVEAEAVYREALEKSHRALGDDDLSTISLLNNLGSLMQDLGRIDEAEPFARAALEHSRRTLGDDDPNTVATLHNLGALLKAQGKAAEAEPLLREAVERSRRRLGDDHPDTLSSLDTLGMLLFLQGRYEEAEAPLREALAGTRRVLGDDHLDTITAMNNVGLLLRRENRCAEAEPLLREAVQRARQTLGDDHPSTSRVMHNLADVLDALGRPAEAEPILREVIERRRGQIDEDDASMLTPRSLLGHVLYGEGKLAEAETELRDVLERAQRALGADHGVTQTAMRRLVDVLEAEGKHAENEPFLRETVALARGRVAADDPQLADALAQLATALVAQSKFAEAEPILRECIAIRAAKLPGSWSYCEAESLLGASLAGQGKHAEAETMLVEAFEKMEPPPEQSLRKRDALERLIAHFRAVRKLDDAARYEALREKMPAASK